MTSTYSATGFDAYVVALVLLSALMHASWNAIVKVGDDRLLTLALVKLPTMLVAVVILLAVGLPRPESWPYLLASAVVNSVYFYVLLQAYRVGDLSLAYPVARGTAPILVLAASLAVVGETPATGAVAGVLAISAGILWMGLRRGASRDDVAAILWAGAVGMTIAGYTVLDGLGARLSGTSLGYTASLNFLTGIPVLTVAVLLRGRSLIATTRRDWLKGLIGGSMMLIAYAIVLHAITLAPMAVVAALRETGVIFAALIGALLLGEGFGARRVLAAAVVAAGIAMLVLFR